MEERLKVLFVENDFELTDPNRVLLTLFRNLDHDKISIHIALTHQLGSLFKAIPDNVSKHLLNVPSGRSAVKALRKKIKEVDPDYIYCSSKEMTLNVAQARMFNGKSKVLWRIPDKYELIVGHGMLSYFRQLLLKRVDLYMVSSEDLKSTLENEFKISSKKITPIISPVDSDLIDYMVRQEVNPFQRENPSEKDVNFICDSKIIRASGLDIIIQAFSWVAKKMPKAHLHIIGEGEENYYQELLALVKSYRLEQHVHFKGQVENPYPYYVHSDLFISCCRTEIVPLALLEYLSLGKVVIASTQTPSKELLIKDGKNGFVIEPEDIEGLSRAILNYKKLKPSKTFSNSLDQFIHMFD